MKGFLARFVLGIAAEVFPPFRKVLNKHLPVFPPGLPRTEKERIERRLDDLYYQAKEELRRL